jgi:hypothetical protein
MRYTIAALALAVLLPSTAAAQESEVSRQTFTFLDNWLDVAVLADAPGTLQLVRGSRGRIDVAARAQQGFAGYGLGGDLTRRLDLTALGADNAQYIVVVPEHVSVRVHLPDGTTATVPSRGTGAVFRWLAAPPAEAGTGLGRGNPYPAAIIDGAAPAADELPVFAEAAAAARAATLPDGMIIAHTTAWSPGTVDIPDLGAVRSLDLRFEGTVFRIAASRPLAVAPGDRNRFELRLDGEPVDVILYVPPASGPFAVHAAGVPIAESRAGRVEALCGNVLIQSPTQDQTWLSFRPRGGRIECH